ncbi:polysaccharide pyruvyl transferase family protein [Fervidobacterium thailandense]|uniref:Polysaccharide pyruvyl transferase domain-containing protein n=1 Tax=Fervidobacterium thailandense TaxID=1008305 RepID=A0A1E3G2Z8_9BACT|nr:polysaccharide pyruvyl transferase family protein [Fervidobacterium thailandense]ODN30530.1 hypothetical protein A4H02_04570 [Fervidobacterium thailandense]
MKYFKTFKNKLGAKIYYSRRTFEVLRDIRNLKENELFLVLLNTPEHSNLGDHAIALGELYFLKDRFRDTSVFEITGHHWRFDKRRLVKLLEKQDVILVHGGGYLGTLWMDEEEVFREIIKRFGDKKIFVFPQTVYFDETREGEEEKSISRNIYTSHRMINFLVREKRSFELLKEEFKLENVHLMPDMALYLAFREGLLPQGKLRENKVILCMRNDKEKISGEAIRVEIESIVKRNGFEVMYTDTVVTGMVRPHEREKYLHEILRNFSESRLIITDRLHGMIFSFITGTPCVAMNNLSGKVMGFYETWFRDVNFIKLASSFKDLEENVELLMKLSEEDIKRERDVAKERLKPYFDELGSLLYHEIHGGDSRVERLQKIDV